jgi:hypothetical protein
MELSYNSSIDEFLLKTNSGKIMKLTSYLFGLHIQISHKLFLLPYYYKNHWFSFLTQILKGP